MTATVWVIKVVVFSKFGECKILYTYKFSLLEKVFTGGSVVLFKSDESTKTIDLTFEYKN